MKLDYTVMDPTGNVTVLVRTPAETARQPDFAAAILAAEPAAEQVGFLSPGGDGADLSLRMAGGEFCGNATMCAAALCCTEMGCTERTVRVRVSGAAEPVCVAVAAQPDGAYACAVEMPRPAGPETVRLALDGAAYRLPLVRFDGISHLMLPGGFGRALAERAAREWCAILRAPALGLMLLDEAAGRMIPLVYVPGGDTLYWERSCASGTAAAGAYLAWRAGAPIEAALAQPGGILRVSAHPVGRITLFGHVRSLRVGEISTEHP